jgi:hypothetical protein
MSLPHVLEARPFYQSAKQRFEDAVFLLSAQRTTGAIYLAGYSVECMLKALILSLTPKGNRSNMLKTFRGSKAHSFDWLKNEYFEQGGTPFPSKVSKLFALVNTWGTELRYKPGTMRYSDADSFIQAVREIMLWADGRM